MASMHGTDRVMLRVGSRKYVLGPVVVDDAGVASANAIDTTASGNGSAVELRLTPAATQALAAATQQVVAAPAPRNEIAMLVDGAIVSAPAVQTPSPPAPSRSPEDSRRSERRRSRPG
jgi:preprotein translocase subunit SecD